MVVAAVAATALALGVQADGVDRLSAAQLAGQRVVFAFEGTRVPPALERRIRRGEAAGVILFAHNVASRSQLRRELRRLQRIPRPAGLRAPLLVMVDQEGGPVRRLPGAPRQAASELRSPGAARAAGRAAAANLRGAGVNVDLAPVADVARRGSAIGRERRAFGGSPRIVGRLAAAFAAGLRSGEVAATAKHWPGFGAAGVNTDFSAQRIALSERTLERVDEPPFRALVDGGVELVMFSTAVYPALDRRNPAALSARIERRLRRRLGFRGVTISDALGTPALAGRERVPERVACDLLLYGGSYRPGARAATALARGIRAGRVSRTGSEISVRRILALRASLGREG
jgi:beta-N-acetylhexosaminidase